MLPATCCQGAWQNHLKRNKINGKQQQQNGKPIQSDDDGWWGDGVGGWSWIEREGEGVRNVLLADLGDIFKQRKQRRQAEEVISIALPSSPESRRRERERKEMAKEALH